MPALASSAKTQLGKKTEWILPLIVLGAVALGALHFWAAASSHSMNADGISYLDIGDAYWRGDWNAALNPVWSPLYPWILGGVMRLFQPGMHWEFPLVHLVNFAIYLFTLACFAIFWKQVSEYREARLAGRYGRDQILLPDWAFNTLGYLLFIWTSLILIEIWSVTPDMLVAAIVYLAAVILVKMRLHLPGWGAFALLGLVLGLGYLAKTIMLPVSFLFFGAALFSDGGLRRILPRLTLALTVFFMIAVPWIALISSAKGRFTYGESGTLTYMKYANHIPYPHWQGGPAGYGSPVHPSRQIFTDPPIYEFAGPVPGTYPISYDPSYWYEGVQLNYDLVEILPNLISSALFYFELFFQQLGPVVAGILILSLMASRQRSSLLDIMRKWSLAVVSILVLVFYSLVYVEGRYIAVFIVLLFTDPLSNLVLPDQPIYRKLVTAASLVMIFFVLGSLIANNLEGYNRLAARGTPAASVRLNSQPPTWPGEVAEELIALGIRPGDSVAVIGYAFDSFWARLARVKIVAEMLISDAAPFWFGDKESQAGVIQAFRGTGARAIVAEDVPQDVFLSDWRRVGKSNVYIYPMLP